MDHELGDNFECKVCGIKNIFTTEECSGSFRVGKFQELSELARHIVRSQADDEEKANLILNKIKPELDKLHFNVSGRSVKDFIDSLDSSNG